MENHQLYQLPNGLSVYHLNKQETDFVYQEIFQEHIYLQHGITLKENALVFDIGANIGLFTLFVKQMSPGARIYAFEPSAEACGCLRRNTIPYGASVTVYQCGIADKDKEAVLTYYPGNSIISGFYSNIDEERQFLRSYIRDHLLQGRGDGKEPPPWYVDLWVDDLLKRKREEPCQLRGISGIITEIGISYIDLLKIDAEKGEVDIINGISEDHWEKINQVVMEAHGSKGVSVDRLCAVLESKGFRVKIEQQQQMVNAGISNIYAIRAQEGSRIRS